LVRLTDATASGLWPTPAKADGERGSLMYQGEHNPTLLGAVKMWPTPCAEDAKNVPYQKGDHGVRYPMLLGAVAPERMWPTSSTVIGGPHGLDGGSWNRQKLKSLVGEEVGRQMASGSLNPQWVSWLMGYPVTWCDLPGESRTASRTASTSSAGSATRSSRRSRSGLPAVYSPPTG